MDDLLGYVWMAALAVFFLGWPVYKLWRRIRRRREAEAIARVALPRGWHFVTEDDGLLAQFQGTPVESTIRRAWNLIEGEHDGRSFAAFDLELIAVYEGRGIEIHVPRDRRVIAVRLPRTSPSFQVLPESALRRGVMGALGRDIELELEEFNRAFTVVGEDRRFTVHALPPATMRHLLEIPALAWNCHGQWLAVVAKGRLLRQLDHLEQWIDYVGHVVDAIPDFAWEPTPE